MRSKLEKSLIEKNHLLQTLYKAKPWSVSEVLQLCQRVGQQLKMYRCQDASLCIGQAYDKKQNILFEGAQGALLDVLHGTYPYVTSSSTLAGSACVGAGVGPLMMRKVLGIVKAYTTRVGSGPFPTEIKATHGDAAAGEHMLKVGGEYGSTTGRQRRCGWLDLVALKYSCRVNGISSLALMKLDVLSGLEELKICTHYTLGGKKISNYPVRASELERAEPVFESVPGWHDDISHHRDMASLPMAARQYVHTISSHLGVPVDVVSVGPDRKQSIWLNKLFV